MPRLVPGRHGEQRILPRRHRKSIERDAVPPSVVDDMALSTSVRVDNGNASDVPPFVNALRRFQLGCWNRGSTFGALSSMNTEIAQSRTSGPVGAPSAAVRFATPDVFELARVCQKASS